MPLEKEELGRRLKTAREAVGLSQEDVAAQVGISRGALAQFEGGAKAPNSLHIVRLAGIYRRELSELLAEQFDEAARDPMTALFRADAQLAGDHERAIAVAECVKLSREYTNLETLLGIDQDRVYDVTYNTPPMRTRWDAIRQGERLAESERSRLRLGDDPLPHLAQLLEAQGVRFIELSLSETISGLFLGDATYGPSIIVNDDHPSRRRVFSSAHEYCHVLADRDRGGLVSRTENREELTEVRANAFAAAFLMPEAGVRSFVRRFGKGEQSRSELRAFDETAVVEAQRRREAHSQDMQVYDVAHLAQHFGVSYETALYRLLNLKLVTDEERVALLQQKDTAASIMRFVGPEPDASRSRKSFRHQLALLAVEALRREVISRAKLREICDLAQVPPDEFEALVATVEHEPEKGPKGRRAHVPRG